MRLSGTLKEVMLAASPLGLSPLREEVVGLGGLEPPTSRLSGARSSQLSYRPREAGCAKRESVVYPVESASKVSKNRAALSPSKPNSKP